MSKKSVETIEVEEIKSKQGRNKLYNVQVKILANETQTIKMIVDEVTKNMLKGKTSGGSVVPKTLTMRVYPRDDVEQNVICLGAMSMVRPAK